MITKSEIINSIRRNSKVLREHHVRRIGIFGSYASGTADERSDIDLLVELSRPLSLPEYVHLSDAITGFLSVKADVVPVTGIKPFLKERIMKEVEWVEGI